ncbi:MAG: glycosyltransferase family 39 protein [Burkholderiaceae bacterium]|nr:glycosyltransferase family 39 protein [Burkholderiaceae bacterium]
MIKTSPAGFFTRLYLPFWITALAIAAWSAAAAYVNPAQFADNLEQFSWSHSLELGYWKHPPLPTWLIAAPIRLIGFSVYWTYAMAAACFIGTAYFTWRMTQRLFGLQAGMFAVLLIGLHIGFSWRAQLYNHNTVLILFSAATVWATLLALDSGKKVSWVLAGALAGMAMLSKYQALVPLIGIAIALYTGGWFKQASVRQGAAIAAATALVVFAPHLIWVASGAGSTIDNALHSAEGLGPLRRLTVLLGFWLVQIRFHLPIFIAVGILVLFRLGGMVGSTENEISFDQQKRAWLLGLIVWPALFVSLVVLAGGVRLEAQWGLQTFQFVVIFIAWRLSIALPQGHGGHAVGVVVMAQVILAGFFVWSIVQPSQTIWKGMRERNFPAATIAKEMTGKWQQATHCPMRYVVGPSFEAAVVAAYSGHNPAVLEDGDFRKSPWITAELLQTHGALYLASNPMQLPANAVISGQVTVPARDNDLQAERQLFWGVVLPQAPCPSAP